MSKLLPLIIVESAGCADSEFLSQLMRNRLEAFDIYHGLLTDSLVSRFPNMSDHSEVANFVMETLFYWDDYASNFICPCRCHPALPTGNVHSFGFECPCMHDDADDPLRNPHPSKPLTTAIDLATLESLLEPVA